jgi:hypothetical protein
VLTVDAEAVRARGGRPGCLHCVIYLFVADLIDGGHLSALDGVLRLAEALGALIGNFDDDARAGVLCGVVELIEEKSRQASPAPPIGHA